MRHRSIAIFASVAAFGFFIWMPLDRWRDEQHHLSALRSEEAQLSSELAELQEQYLETIGPAETERLARGRLGMVKPGERAYVVPTPPEPIIRPEVIEPDAAPAPDPIWQRAASALLRALSARP